MENEITESNFGYLEKLKKFTDARINLGRVGNSIETVKSLEFQLDLALAKDSVKKELDFELLKSKLETRNLNSIIVSSNANSKQEYLKRPDLGRTLSSKSEIDLKKISGEYDLSIVIGDGLSARSIEEQCIPYLDSLFPILNPNWKISDLVLVKYARVAIGDEVGEILNSKIVLVLIGERPGLSSPNSMGAYITYSPKKEKKDSERNCISNIRVEGLSHSLAATKTKYLLEKSFQEKISGTGLKDEMIEGLDLIDQNN
jgi:ethanolamine ammonia-lyase small subunit